MTRPVPARVLVLLIALALTAPALNAFPLALAPGDAAPAMIGYQYPERRYRDVDWSQNKLTVINFWATWCVMCKDEMPLLQKLQDKHRDAGVEIIGVYSKSSSVADVTRYVQPMGVSYTLLELRKGVNERWGGITALPTTFLVNSEGKILRRYVGARPEQTDGLFADVENALAGLPLGKLVIPEARPDEPRLVAPGAK